MSAAVRSARRAESAELVDEPFDVARRDTGEYLAASHPLDDLLEALHGLGPNLLSVHGDLFELGEPGCIEEREDEVGEQPGGEDVERRSRVNGTFARRLAPVPCSSAPSRSNAVRPEMGARVRKASAPPARS